MSSALTADEAIHRAKQCAATLERYEQTGKWKEADRAIEHYMFTVYHKQWQASRKRGQSGGQAFFDLVKGNAQKLTWKTIEQHSKVYPYLLKRPGAKKPAHGTTLSVEELIPLMKDPETGKPLGVGAWYKKIRAEESKARELEAAAEQKHVTNRGASICGGVIHYEAPSPGEATSPSLQAELQDRDKGLMIGKRVLKKDDVVRYTVQADTPEAVGAVGQPGGRLATSGASVVYMAHQSTTFEVYDPDDGTPHEVTVGRGELLKVDVGVHHRVKPDPAEPKTVDVALLMKRGSRLPNRWFDTIHVPLTDGEYSASVETRESTRAEEAEKAAEAAAVAKVPTLTKALDSTTPIEILSFDEYQKALEDEDSPEQLFRMDARPEWVCGQDWDDGGQIIRVWGPVESPLANLLHSLDSAEVPKLPKLPAGAAWQPGYETMDLGEDRTAVVVLGKSHNKRTLVWRVPHVLNELFKNARVLAEGSERGFDAFLVEWYHTDVSVFIFEAGTLVSYGCAAYRKGESDRLYQLDCVLERKSGVGEQEPRSTVPWMWMVNQLLARSKAHAVSKGADDDNLECRVITPTQQASRLEDLGFERDATADDGAAGDDATVELSRTIEPLW